MISGITTALNIREHGFPFKWSIRSWSSVCDEIIIITDPNEPALSDLIDLCGQYPNVHVRGIANPKNFDTYRFLGYYFCNRPDYVIHFDLDYLIAPLEGQKLREFILAAPDTTDIITYVLTYLNRSGEKELYIPEQRHVPPHDGVRGEYPLIVNPRRQNFIAPYEGVNKDNIQTNFECVMSLNPNRWGHMFNTKFLNHNPYNFNVLRSGVLVDHLVFYLSDMALDRKLSHPYWVNQGIDRDYVVNGHEDHDAMYYAMTRARLDLA